MPSSLGGYKPAEVLWPGSVHWSSVRGDTTMRPSFIRTVAAALAVCALGAASAQDIKERTLKLGLQNPKGHPAVMGAEKFAEIVAAQSGGKIKVALFPGGVLGGDAQTVSAVQGGTVEMTVLNSGILAAQVKEFAVYDFPF